MTHWFKTHTGRLVNLDRAYDIDVDGADMTRVAALLTDGHTSVLGFGSDKANASLIGQHIVLTDCSTWEQAVELAGGDGDDSCTTWDKATDHRTGAAQPAVIECLSCHKPLDFLQPHNWEPGHGSWHLDCPDPWGAAS